MISIASQLAQPDPAVQVTKTHEGEADNVENGHADTVDQVVDDHADESQKHECNCECNHSYSCLRVSNLYLYAKILKISE